MKKSKSVLIRLIIFIVCLGILIPLGMATKLFDLGAFIDLKTVGEIVFKLAIMIFGVCVLQSLASLILSIPKPTNHRVRSVLSIIASLVKYIAFIVIVCWGLSIIGVDMTTIIASIGILALIVGFSAESLIADIVTGTFMIFENQCNVGDIVEIDGFRGTVTAIGIRTTCITDAGDNVKIVNNSAMKNILNRSDKPSRSVCDIGIPYETDLEKLETSLPALLKQIFDKHQDVMKDVPKYVGVQELADSAVVLRFIVNVEEKDIFSGARLLNHDLLLGFRQLGVECPFPQVDVHQYNAK